MTGVAELALGVVRDPLLGPLVMVAAGGTTTELAHDRAVALPPVDVALARRLLDRLRVRPLLDGFRGRPRVDADLVAAAVVAVSALAAELGDALEALDVNPLLATPDGPVAVDALVLPRRTGESTFG